MKTAEQALKNIARSGGRIWRIFVRYGPESILSGEDAVKLTNSYGLSIHDIIMIAASHRMTVDIDEYVKLMEIEKITHIKPKL